MIILGRMGHKSVDKNMFGAIIQNKWKYDFIINIEIHV